MHAKYAKWFADSNYTVVFTGAGMSTESGVPDFRSQHGLWRGRDPQRLASVEAMKYNREDFIEFYHMRIKRLQDIKPHDGYRVLTSLAEKKLLQTIITQNTDGLHEIAGNPNVITLHGTIRQLHCHDCRQTYSTEKYFSNEWECSCGGFIRPSVVLFGEALDHRQLEAAEKEAMEAELFIVLGSSLVVSPANHYPAIAKQHGAKLLIVNHDPTPFDSIADAVINDQKIGDFLQSVWEQIQL